MHGVTETFLLVPPSEGTWQRWKALAIEYLRDGKGMLE